VSLWHKAPLKAAARSCHNWGRMRLGTLFLLFAFAAFAQLTDGVATSVTRTVTLTADEADFSIVAGAALGTTQQQVAQIFLDAGVSGLCDRRWQVATDRSCRPRRLLPACALGGARLPALAFLSG